jgi:hypothetical protein
MSDHAPMRGHAEYRASRSAAMLLGVALWAASLNAHSELVEIVWKDSNRFDRTMTVAPGKFAELCGSLGAGKAVTWSFDADGDLNFNIHYHVGKEVRYPARKERVRRSEGELAVDRAQEYCWMWTNKSAVAAKLAVQLVLK